MPNEVDKAIKTVWDANSSLATALPGGVRDGLLPPGTSYAYASYAQIANPLSLRSTNGEYNNMLIQFLVFAETKDEVATGMQAIRDVFNDSESAVQAQMAAGTGTVLAFNWESELITQDDEDRWQGLLQYTVKRRRDR